jgi:hypothetical protein
MKERNRGRWEGERVVSRIPFAQPTARSVSKKEAGVESSVYKVRQLLLPASSRESKRRLAGRVLFGGAPAMTMSGDCE